MVQGGTDQDLIKRRNGVLQHHRRNIGIAVGGIIRHHLGFIRQADQVFAGFDQAANRAGHRNGFIGEGHGIPHTDLVGRRVGVRKPDALRIRIAVGFPLHQQDARNLHVGADGQGHRVRTIPYCGVNGQIAGCVLHALDGQHLVQVFLRKAFIGKNPEISKACGVINFPGTDIQGIPFDMKAQEDANAQGNHNHHGDELGFVAPEGAKQFFQQHHQSTSSTDRG